MANATSLYSTAANDLATISTTPVSIPPTGSSLLSVPIPPVISTNPPAQATVPPVIIPPPVSSAPFTPRPPRNTYEAQIALVRQGLSPGVLDGVLGPQTRAALRAVQEREGLPVTGDLDHATKTQLRLSEPTEKIRTLEAKDLARLTPVGRTWLEKSQQSRLDFETVLELLAEESQAHPNLLRKLNSSVDWPHLTDGSTVLIPNVRFPLIRGKAAVVRIQLNVKIIQAWDSHSNLLAHLPCSIARKFENRPVGQWFVEKVAGNPSYSFDPEVFPESPEARSLKRKLLIPPGPNNPVGTAWIGLNRAGYGIHGTPRPEEVGRTESHGCFRLANWNASYLAQLVRIGTPVIIEP